MEEDDMLESNADGSVRLLNRSVAGIPEEDAETDPDPNEDTSQLPLGPEPELQMTKVASYEEFEPPRKDSSSIPIATVPDRFKASAGEPSPSKCCTNTVGAKWRSLR